MHKPAKPSLQTILAVPMIRSSIVHYLLPFRMLEEIEIAAQITEKIRDVLERWIQQVQLGVLSRDDASKLCLEPEEWLEWKYRQEIHMVRIHQMLLNDSEDEMQMRDAKAISEEIVSRARLSMLQACYMASNSIQSNYFVEEYRDFANRLQSVFQKLLDGCIKVPFGYTDTLYKYGETIAWACRKRWKLRPNVLSGTIKQMVNTLSIREFSSFYDWLRRIGHMDGYDITASDESCSAEELERIWGFTTDSVLNVRAWCGLEIASIGIAAILALKKPDTHNII